MAPETPEPTPAPESPLSEDERNPEGALEAALALASTSKRANNSPPRLTRERRLTRRGVMWLGQTCNLRCYFCYFIDRIKANDHPEHAFMSIEKAKKICDTLVNVYGNNAIDIQGGEPTIWKHCLELVRHCHAIGLEPTLITNALVLDKKEVCAEYLAAGVRDLLVSVHGIGEVHDRIVGRKGAHARQMVALRNLQEIGLPFRYNCVLSKPVVRQLPAIAKLAVATGAGAVNFLAFNPFEDQAKDARRSAENVPRYGEIVEYLTEALDILDENKVEANVRYYPLCTVEERHRKSMYNFQQLSYDPHEWDLASWTWTGMQPQRMRDGDVAPTRSLSGQRSLHAMQKPVDLLLRIPVLKDVLPKVHQVVLGSLENMRDRDAMYAENAKVRAELHCGYTYAKCCETCSVKAICDGFHGDYAALFGTDEAVAIHLAQDVKDPRHYIAHQEKLPAPEDKDRSEGGA